MKAKNKTRNVKFDLNIFTVVPMIFLALILILSMQGGITGFSVLDNASNLTNNSSLANVSVQTNQTLELNETLVNAELSLNETLAELETEINATLEVISETEAITEIFIRKTEN